MAPATRNNPLSDNPANGPRQETRAWHPLQVATAQFEPDLGTTIWPAWLEIKRQSGGREARRALCRQTQTVR